jgi:hypothetical protein
VMSRYSISATNVGSTHVAFGFLMGLESLDLGLTTVSSCLRIWLEAVRDHPGPDLPHVDQVLALFLAEVEGGEAGGVLDESDDGKFALLNDFDFLPGFRPLRSIRRVRSLQDNAFPVQLGGMLKHPRPVADQMLRLENRHLDVVFAEKVQEQLLPFDLRKLAKVSIPPEESKASKLGAPACPLPVRPAVPRSWCGPHGRPRPPRRRWLGRDSESTGNLGEAFGPVETVRVKTFLRPLFR